MKLYTKHDRPLDRLCNAFVHEAAELSIKFLLIKSDIYCSVANGLINKTFHKNRGLRRTVLRGML